MKALAGIGVFIVAMAVGIISVAPIAYVCAIAVPGIVISG